MCACGCRTERRVEVLPRFENKAYIGALYCRAHVRWRTLRISSKREFGNQLGNIRPHRRTGETSADP